MLGDEDVSIPHAIYFCRIRINEPSVPVHWRIGWRANLINPVRRMFSSMHHPNFDKWILIFRQMNHWTEHRSYALEKKKLLWCRGLNILIHLLCATKGVIAIDIKTSVLPNHHVFDHNIIEFVNGFIFDLISSYMLCV